MNTQSVNTKRALVTGGAGFLGSHLCDGILGVVSRVLAADNLLTGRLENIAHLRNDPRFEFVEKDVCYPADWGRLDYVFHFASPASPVDYAAHGIETLRVGSYGTFEALETALRCGAKFMMASTSECYGDALVHPQTESYWGNVNPIGPRSVYDEAKRFSEAVTMAYHRYRLVDTRILRIFSTYGPRMQINDGRVIPNFMWQAPSVLRRHGHPHLHFAARVAHRTNHPRNHAADRRSRLQQFFQNAAHAIDDAVLDLQPVLGRAQSHLLPALAAA